VRANLRLPGNVVCLNENLADGNILVDIPQGLLHGRPGAQNGHSHQRPLEHMSMERSARERHHRRRRVRKMAQGLFDNQSRQPIREKHKVVALRLLVAHHRQHAAHLRRLLQLVQRVWTLMQLVVRQRRSMKEAPLRANNLSMVESRWSPRTSFSDRRTVVKIRSMATTFETP
jgi:hypothetical protein